MADSSCLLDTNILLRWIKPDDHDYQLVASAIETMLIAGAVLCYTSQNVGESLASVVRQLVRNICSETEVPAFQRVCRCERPFVSCRIYDALH